MNSYWLMKHSFLLNPSLRAPEDRQVWRMGVASTGQDWVKWLKLPREVSATFVLEEIAFVNS